MKKNIYNLYNQDDNWFIEKKTLLFGLIKIKSLYLNEDNKWTSNKIGFTDLNNALIHFNQIL
jgi:hypothetical protein